MYVHTLQNFANLVFLGFIAGFRTSDYCARESGGRPTIFPKFRRGFGDFDAKRCPTYVNLQCIWLTDPVYIIGRERKAFAAGHNQVSRIMLEPHSGHISVWEFYTGSYWFLIFEVSWIPLLWSFGISGIQALRVLINKGVSYYG